MDIVRRPMSAEEFIGLRHAVGWKAPSADLVEIGLRNSLFSVCAEVDGQLIGCGRLIGDGGLVFYVQDIIVKPEYQGKGVGRAIVEEIMGFIRATYPPRAMVCLMAAKGKEGFYRKFGFIERPNDIYGAGMIQYVQ